MIDTCNVYIVSNQVFSYLLYILKLEYEFFYNIAKVNSFYEKCQYISTLSHLITFLIMLYLITQSEFVIVIL